MKKILLTLIILFAIYIAKGQTYQGPITKPTSGYGADGSYALDSVTFTNPLYTSQLSILYYPTGITSPVPTIFFSHGYGGNNSLFYRGLLKFIAEKGFAVVFIPYSASVAYSVNDRYDILKSGFRYAATNFTNIIDTTKVGFVGHSFGGGASIGISYHFFSTYNWGANARFIMPMAQWYSYDISQSNLQSFPVNTKLLSFIFDNDPTNDHRMAIEIFHNSNVPYSEKDIVFVRSDTISSYFYDANHGTCTSLSSYDALDYYAIYRLLDALMDYSFNGNASAKNTALGNGSSVQTLMPGGMKSLVVSDTLTAWRYPESLYTYPCSDILNPRLTYCGSTNTTSVSEIIERKSEIIFYPNPTTGIITLDKLSSKENCEYSVFSFLGCKILNGKLHGQKLDLTSLPNGIYFIKIDEFIFKAMKE